MPIDRIAFAIGHPGFFRYWCFSLRGALMQNENGRTTEIPEDARESGELVVPPMDDNQAWKHFQNDEDAAAWACSTFENLVRQATEAVS
jgi:hypothetical protein